MSVMEIAQEAVNSIALGTPLESVIEKVDQRFEEGKIPPHPLADSLERIASALEGVDQSLQSIAVGLAPQKRTKVRAVLKKPEGHQSRFVSRDLEAQEPEDEAPDKGYLGSWERCGFLVEKHTHPLDQSINLYQVSRNGTYKTLSEEDWTNLDSLDDDAVFFSAMLKELGVQEQQIEETTDGVEYEIEDEENE